MAQQAEYKHPAIRAINYDKVCRLFGKYYNGSSSYEGNRYPTQTQQITKNIVATIHKNV